MKKDNLMESPNAEKLDQTISKRFFLSPAEIINLNIYLPKTDFFERKMLKFYHGLQYHSISGTQPKITPQSN